MQKCVFDEFSTHWRSDLIWTGLQWLSLNEDQLYFVGWTMQSFTHQSMSWHRNSSLKCKNEIINAQKLFEIILFSLNNGPGFGGWFKLNIGIVIASSWSKTTKFLNWKSLVINKIIFPEKSRHFGQLNASTSHYTAAADVDALNAKYNAIPIKVQ